ncbi:MAG: serine/threonine-protein kinase, partial [Geodermatophilaceae bacterium]
MSTGQVIAGYRIESLVATGGHAVVYRAHDLSLGRDVALKVLATDVAQSEAFRQRFIRESQLAASLDHPNIIPIYDADAVDDLLYIAMRYVPGPTLQSLLAQTGPMAFDRTVALLGQVASALDTAHAHGLVHRDVKPHNILVTPPGERGDGDHAYLTDFGLTKRVASLSGLTAVGNFLGTIDYIAPEQITGDPVSSQTDVYALGCVLFQALTGQVPFIRDHDAAVIYAHLNDPAPSARALRPSLPAEVDAVLAQALAKQPADRHASCSGLIKAMHAAMASGPGNGTRPVSREAPTRLTARPPTAGDKTAEADRLSVAETRSADQVSLSDTDAPTYIGELSGAGLAAGSVRVTGRPRVFPASGRTRLIIAAIVAAVTALGVTAVVVSNRSPGAAVSRAVLPFPDESYPAKGIVVSRAWVLQGRHGDQVHGELVVISKSESPIPFVEALPKSMVASASRITFSPQKSRTLRDDPVVELTATGHRSTITYDVPVARGPVKLSRLREWAAAQQQEAKAFLGKGAPVTLATLTIAPKSLRLLAGGPAGLVQLAGLYSNRKPADPASLAKAVFDVIPPGIVAVERRGALYAIRPLSPGSADVTAYLGPRSAVLKVQVLKPPG